MIEKRFDFERMFARIVRYYLGRRHFSKERANLIAQRVVQREMALRTCQNAQCRHLLHDHIRNHDACLVERCDCRGFLRPAG